MTKIEDIKTRGKNGLLVYLRFEDSGGYEAQATYFDDGTISDLRIDERRRRSGMPKEFVYCDLKSIDWGKYGSENTDTQRKIVNAFVFNFKDFQCDGRGLYISSKTKGSGKTVISCAIANEILKSHDISVKFISVAEYVELVKAKDYMSGELRRSILEAGLLILDDIGAQVENKDWITEALFHLIYSRNKNHYPTIFTSNFEMNDLKMDDRIADSIYEVSIPVLMPEVNVRRQLADKHTKEFIKKVIDE